MNWTTKSVFEAGGLLSQKLEGYEPRKSQEKYAQSVEKALSGKYNLAIEGPCGTGKSLAYLVPAIEKVLRLKFDSHGFPIVDDSDSSDSDPSNNYLGAFDNFGKKKKPSGKHVVVATANIALQEQLVTKDLPFLASILPSKFSFALVKGRNNYLCINKLYDYVNEPPQTNLHWGGVDSFAKEEEKKILEWVHLADKGDKNELTFVPSEEAWRKFSSMAEDCLGKRCPFRSQCFANRAKVALQDIDVIVTNYHLLFAAVSARINSGGADVVLPPFRYLILDEAHRVADIARDFFGWELSEFVLYRLASKFAKLIKDIFEDHEDRVERIISSIQVFTSSLGGIYGKSKGALRINKKISGLITSHSLLDSLNSIANVCHDMASNIESDKELAEAEKAEKDCLKIVSQLESLITIDDDNAVYFMEPHGKQGKLRVVKRVLDIGSILWNEMFCKCESSIATSATMAIQGDCGYICREIGMLKGEAVVVDSPFDFKKQAMIVLSDKAPDPTEKDYPVKVADVVAEVIRQAKGRTLCLFTSYRVLNHVSSFLGKEFEGYRILTQGDAPRMQLVQQFKEDISSVLLGTESFWTGVDVPGEALSALVIDKIPFPTPGDPVLEALSEKAGEKNGFWKVSVPRAVLQLRQGVGRLIRRRDDRGVVAILDCRLLTKGYGNIFTDSLPSMARSSSIRNGSIGRFLEKRAD